MGSNTAVYWMNVSIAYTYNEKEKNKGSQIGHTIIKNNMSSFSNQITLYNFTTLNMWISNKNFKVHINKKEFLQNQVTKTATE